MKLKSKKIIAKEFLFLAIVLLLSALSFFSFNLFNLRINGKVDGLNRLINAKQIEADSLFAKAMPYFGAIQIDDNGIPYNKQNFVIKSYTKEGLPIFDKTKLVVTSKDTLNHNRAVLLTNEIARLTVEKNKQLSGQFRDKDIQKFTFQVMLILTLILFGFRYFFQATKWSLNVLKQKSE